MSEKNQILPPGWYKAVDPNSGRDYYYKGDGTRQWHFPQDEIEVDDENDDEGDENQSLKTQNKEGDDVEGSVISLLLHFLLFPFASIFRTGIWICIQLVFILLEMISGFVSLWIGGIGFLKAFDLEFDDVKVSFVVVFLIVDSLVWLGENILHLLLMGTGGGQYILKNPPSKFNTSLLEVIPKNSGKPLYRALYFVRLGLFVLFRAFQFIWTVIAFIKISLEALRPTSAYISTQQGERGDEYPQLKDSQQWAHTTNLVRSMGVCYITLNLVSLGLWVVMFVVLVLLRQRKCSIEDKSRKSEADSS